MRARWAYSNHSAGTGIAILVHTSTTGPEKSTRTLEAKHPGREDGLRGCDGARRRACDAIDGLRH